MATIGSQINVRDAGQIDLKGYRHRSLNVTDVDDADTLSSATSADIPKGVALAMWQAGAATEECTASADASSGESVITFATGSSTSFDGVLHLWYGAS